MTKLKTPEYYLDEVAKEDGKLSFIQATDYAPWAIKDIVKEAMLRHSKEACEEQRKICADEAKSGRTLNEDPYYNRFMRESILNAKSPIE